MDYYQKVEKLNEQLTELTLALQREVKELKEDTLVNAQHIKVLKQKNIKNLGVVNDKLKEHIDATADLAEDLGQMSEEKENNNYASFLKSLLESDFKALQSEMLEESKREILNAKTSNNTKGSFSFGIIFNILSLVSFVLIVFILVKYKLFFG